MTEDLKPCPFCGGEAERVDIEDGENAGGSVICCTACQASGNLEFGRKENFMANWNRRILSTPNPGDADGWSGTDNAAPGTEKYALQRALDFIKGLTADPLLMGDDIEMTLDDVQSHARIELDSIIRQRRAALEGRTDA